MAGSAQLVQGVQVLILLVFVHCHEKTRLLTFINPINLENLEASRSHKLVKLGEHLPSRGLLEVFGDRTSLNDHAEKVKIITLLKHQFVS